MSDNKNKNITDDNKITSSLEEIAGITNPFKLFIKI